MPLIARMALLSYSLVHCSDEMIEEILRKRMSLKNEILINRMGKTVTRPPADSPRNDADDVESKSADHKSKMVFYLHRFNFIMMLILPFISLMKIVC